MKTAKTSRPATLQRLLLFYCCLGFCMNMVHPVTPTLVVELGFDSTLYSALSSTLALTNFLCAPLWGYLSDRHGRRPMLLIGTITYACSQLLFSQARTVPVLLVARLCGGISSAGYLTASLAYVVDVSPPERRGKNLAIYTALFSICSSFGYLGGGTIGTRFNVITVFYVQLTLLCLVTILGYFILGESRDPEQMALSLADKTAKKFYDFKAMGAIIKGSVAIFMVSVVLASFSSMGYDNAFNFYIKDVLNFPPSYNGYIKATTGTLGLIANLTLNLWLMKRFAPQNTLLVIFPCMAAALFVATRMETT
ncbi:MAG: MFS transporter, partial [Clostridia bacterium]|nr:MFS transporter [Clostridia bacterium]